MKKVLCIVLILVCALWLVSATAEEFTIRNGIRFGMTKEQVFAIESDLDFEELKQYESITRYCADGTFEGYEEGRVFYVFDDNALVQAVFHFESGADIDYLCSCFEAREQILNERYGSTGYTSATGRKMESRKLSHYHRYLFDTTMSAYSQRVLQYNDCVVCIDNYVDVVDFERSWSSCEIVYTVIRGDTSGLEITADLSGAAAEKEQADSEAFIFRHGVTWGMKEAEVVAAEGQYAREHRDENTRYLYYDPVEFSIVKNGIMGCAFSNKTGNLIAVWYVAERASAETTETLLNAYRMKYGEELEANSEEFDALDHGIFGSSPNAYVPDSLHKWNGPAGTQIWMVKRTSGNLILGYYSPELIESTNEDRLTENLMNGI